MSGRCTCTPADLGGVDPGCGQHGEHPCLNWSRQPHVAGVRGKGCCDHCNHVEVKQVAGGVMTKDVEW